MWEGDISSSVHGDVEVMNILPDAELGVEHNGRRSRRIGLYEYKLGAACCGTPLVLSIIWDVGSARAVAKAGASALLTGVGRSLR